jgi:dTDP-4-dehydrorhamnose 3,5-epimerase-like enzyme
VSDTVSQRLRFSATKLAGLQTVDRLALQDARGWFERSYCLDTFAQAGLQKTIQQINRTKTLQKGSVRGMHYQLPPFAEAKVVRLTCAPAHPPFCSGMLKSFQLRTAVRC